MIALSSTSEVVAAMQHAHSITLTAYVMRSGQVLNALESAAKRGARVQLKLEATPYGDPSGDLRQGNIDAAERLRGAGASVRLVDQDGQAPLHMKAAVIDRAVAYLDDRNWPGDGLDTIVRDTDARDVNAVLGAISDRGGQPAPLATRKDAALLREARTIYQSADAHERISVESESFGYGRIYAALLTVARGRTPVRLLVAQRDVTPKSQPALLRLQKAGVDVRVGATDEKMAVAQTQAWLGSANATAGVPSQIDWGLRIFERSNIAGLQSRFERNWAAAKPFAVTEI
ncbi:MAG: hypothetical protein M3N19_03380 [Candidatus Eremiobacteraeota bacterium]|nr:hypothetical protein [Candidatus Eremiobacteraeota bacterium]